MFQVFANEYLIKYKLEEVEEAIQLLLNQSMITRTDYRFFIRYNTVYN